MKYVPNEIEMEEYGELLELQNSILEKVAGDAEQQDVLDKLCRLQEKMVPGSLASIMMLDSATKLLYVAAAPSLPKEAKPLLDGLEPGAENGSCANVVLRKEPQFVCDISTDQRWNKIRGVAETYNLNACWSMPVIMGGEVVGTFALTSFSGREPSSFHKMLLSIGARIVSIVLRREQQRESAQFMALYDPLTALPNRSMFEERINHMIARSERSGTIAAICYIDLDRFKHVNETFGHEAGDRLLKDVAKRLQKSVSATDTVARFGGDEFVVLFEDVAGRAEVLAKAEAFVEALKQPFFIGKEPFVVYASIGIALFSEDGSDVSTLLRHADSAMYEAKQSEEHICFYVPKMGVHSERRLLLEKELHQGIERDEFVVYYQPVFKGDGNTLHGAEALVRWQHPDRGLLLPVEFIPFAEDSGLIAQIDEIVLEQVVEDLRRWNTEADNYILPVSVNISGRHINEKDVTRLTRILNKSTLGRDCIGLELTETYLMRFAEETVIQLDRLKHAGVKLAMDDFGSGYSSLGYLKRFKIDTLKIDQMLIRDIVEDSDDRSIADAIIRMGHSLGLQVVAEGVETEAQFETLHAFGCDALQGFYFDHALPAEDFEMKYLRRGR